MLGAQTEASQADGKARVFIYTSGVWVLGRTIKAAEEDAPLDPPPHVEWRPAHEDLVLSAFSATLRTVVVRPGHRLWRRARDCVGLDQGRAQRPDPRRRPRQEPLAAASTITTSAISTCAFSNRRPPRASSTPPTKPTNASSDIVEAIAAQVPQRPDIRYMPMTEARKKLGTYADALALDQKVRSPKARALGWAPTQTGVVNSVARLVEEFRNAQRERNS